MIHVAYITLCKYRLILQYLVKIILSQQINSYMSCYLILRKWENPQLPAKKQVFKRFGLMVRDPSLISFKMTKYITNLQETVTPMILPLSDVQHK